MHSFVSVCTRGMIVLQPHIGISRIDELLYTINKNYNLFILQLKNLTHLSKIKFSYYENNMGGKKFFFSLLHEFLQHLLYNIHTNTILCSFSC